MRDFAIFPDVLPLAVSLPKQDFHTKFQPFYTIFNPNITNYKSFCIALKINALLI